MTRNYEEIPVTTERLHSEAQMVKKDDKAKLEEEEGRFSLHYGELQLVREYKQLKGR